MENEKCTKKASELLAGVEISLGCLMHSMRIPMRAQILAFHQAFFLSLLQKQDPSWLMPLRVSVISAFVKFLSITSKRLSPSLGITLQGAVFSLCTFLFGINLWSRTIAFFLIGLSSTLHAFLIVYLFAFFTSYHPLLLLLKYAKLPFAAFLGFTSFLLARFSFQPKADQWWVMLEKLTKKTGARGKKKQEGPVFLRALKDLLSPFYLITFSIASLSLYLERGLSPLFFLKVALLLGSFFLLRLLFQFLPAEKIGGFLFQKLPETWREEAFSVLRNL